MANSVYHQNLMQDPCSCTAAVVSHMTARHILPAFVGKRTQVEWCQGSVVHFIFWFPELLKYYLLKSVEDTCDISLKFSHALKIWVHSMSTKMTRACCEIPIFALAQDGRIKDPHQKWVHQQLLFWNPSLSPFGHVYSLIKLTVAVVELGNKLQYQATPQCYGRQSKDKGLPSFALACNIICAIMSEVINHVGGIQIRVLRVPRVGTIISRV